MMTNVNTNSFHEITRIASQLFQTPVAMITVVNELKSFSGDESDFGCAREISDTLPLLEENAPLSIDGLRTSLGKYIFYAGVPLKSPCGQNIGTLSVVDFRPRELTSDDFTYLELLAKQVTAQLELSRHKKLLQEQSKMSSLGFMTAGMAHEINNPLTIMFGKVKIMRHLARDNKIGTDEILEFTDKMECSIQRISGIVKGLKMFTRDGSQDAFEKVNVSDLVRDTLSFCESKFSKSNVTLSVSEDAQDAQIDCRFIQISQVIINLLNNAVDAVSGQENAWVHFKTEEDTDNIVFSVEDSGSGIPQSLRDKIMQPFFTTKEYGKGTGLGLSLSKTIIESHKGKLTLDDNSKNTKFIIQLPKKHLQS